MKLTFITLILFLLFRTETGAQHISLANIAQSENAREESVRDRYAKYIDKSDSEYKMLLFGSFLFYKEFVSSQDGQNCSFSPSCSEYAILAIKKEGIFKGGMMFFDRYTRCNSPNKKWYEIDHKKRRLIDNVE